jgi:ATP-dependent DNA helicase RecG
MLTQAELVNLIEGAESDRLEKTISTQDYDKFAEAICAFANDVANHRAPGYLLIGVKNDNTLAGITISDDDLQHLAAVRSDGQILPQPAMMVEKVTLPDGEVAVVTVQLPDQPTMRYRGKVHVRIGPRRAIVNEQKECMLSERRVLTA